MQMFDKNSEDIPHEEQQTKNIVLHGCSDIRICYWGVYVDETVAERQKKGLQVNTMQDTKALKK